MKELEKFVRKLFRNLPLIFGLLILFMDLLSVLAPVFAHFGLDEISNVIYYIYQFLCHQRPWRSIHLFDHQMAWCTRDTFIYLSMGLSALFVTKFKIRGIKWYVPLLAIIPFATDGVVQLIAEFNGVLNNKDVYFYASTNFIRMLTGTVFGTGAGLWLFSLLDETIEEDLEVQSSKSKVKTDKPKFKNLKMFIIIISTCFISYLGLVQIWRISSDEYKPSGILDNIRYFPGVNYEETDRCGHCR